MREGGEGGTNEQWRLEIHHLRYEREKTPSEEKGVGGGACAALTGHWEWR